MPLAWHCAARRFRLPATRMHGAWHIACVVAVQCNVDSTVAESSPMPTKRKRTTKSPAATQRRAATPQARGDTDCRGGGSGYVQDNLPRKLVAGQGRKPAATPARPPAQRARGVDEVGGASFVTPDDARAYRLASLRARRRGLH